MQDKVQVQLLEAPIYELLNSKLMATSSNFFGLRRGSTKSLTFQVFRGKQVTKDRVTTVRNPQSVAQMRQRLKLPIVANARAILKTLVNHSFEGTAYGEESLKLFSSLNLKKDALTVNEWVPKGAMDCGNSNLIVSRGSLPSIEMLDMQYSNNAFTITSTTLSDYIDMDTDDLPNGDDTFKGPIVKAFLKANPFLQEGDQLTILASLAGQDYTYPVASDGTVDSAHVHQFVISRIIFDSENGDSNWKCETGGESGYFSDGYFTFGYRNGQTSKNNMTFTCMYTPQGVSATHICAYTIIHSRLVDGVWKRSTQRLNISGGEGEPSWLSALYSYKYAGTVSSKYLNSGAEGVDITGGYVQTDA